MALDGMYLNSLLKIEKDILINSKIDKINQPEKDEIIITIRKDRKNLKFLISSSPRFARLHFTEIPKENPIKAPMFLMVLRKYILGGKIINITQKDNDRIVIMEIENQDEMGFDSVYSLIIEIMGRHSNISLVRNRDNKIMESIKHITPDINSYRILLPGVTYVYPPKSEKLNPFDFSYDDFNSFITEKEIAFNDNFFAACFTGIAKPFSKALYKKITQDIPEPDRKELYEFIKNITDNIDKYTSFRIYTTKAGYIKDFYSISLDDEDNEGEYIVYENPDKMMDDFYFQKDKQDRLQNKSANLQKLVHTNIERCSKKTKILEKTLEDCDKKESYKIKGDLLTSFIYSIKKGDTECTLLNFYNENEEEYMKIKLDPNKTPSENVQSYYKKYNKLKVSEEYANEQLARNKEESDYLNSVLTNILNIENYDEIDEIKHELVETGYIKLKKNGKNRKNKASKPHHFISSDGIDIYVGKNNMQNDHLSLKFAHKNYMWLHAKDMPGSHVIICSFDVPDQTLIEGAMLAAHYSKGKTSPKVEVDYTKVKELKKPNGAKPGMVIYHTNYSVLVSPDLTSEEFKAQTV